MVKRQALLKGLLKGLLGMAVALTLLAGGGRPGMAQAASRYFPQTNHTVKDPFLTYWNNNGGLAQQGYPITDEQPEVNAADGKTYTTQYFERSRFELHPEMADPNFRVLLGLLGREAFLAKHPNGKVDASPVIVPGGPSRFFAETGHTVSGLFLTYWNNNGGLRQQGFPITESYIETNDIDGKQYITQYFERARFEYHPEQTDPRYQVLLGLVGTEIYARKQSGGLPRPTPAPAACTNGVHQVFQFAVSHNTGLAAKLGCATDRGADFFDGVHGGRQSFKYATLIAIDPSPAKAYGYGLYPDGTYLRVDYTGQDAGGKPPEPGDHFLGVWEDLNRQRQVGAATKAEDWGDGAVQHYQNGTLYYVGAATQLAYAVFPADASSGAWAVYASR